MTGQDKGETRNEGRKRKALSWEEESNDSDHLYELIRGLPAMIVRNEAPTTNNDFIPKRNLIELKRNFIGSKISKTGKRGFFIGEKGCFGTSFLSEQEKVSNLSETKFEVSLDRDFSRDCEFGNTA